MAGGLLLGPVLFRGFEVPERIAFGGEQRLAVHVLPGGGRVVDAMGPDEGPIRWSGVFSGVGAGARVRLLERMRRDGAVHPLTWGGWRHSVVVESFTAETVKEAWVPYKICVVVVSAGDAGVVDDVLSGGAWPGLDAGTDAAIEAAIEAAGAGMGSGDVEEALSSAGSLARMVAGRAFAAWGRQ